MIEGVVLAVRVQHCKSPSTFEGQPPQSSLYIKRDNPIVIGSDHYRIDHYRIDHYRIDSYRIMNYKGQISTAWFTPKSPEGDLFYPLWFPSGDLVTVSEQ
jgi:hypothetical protein